jgi:hypothetical protein
VRRIVAAFKDAGLEATIAASFSDSPVPGGISAVSRALKKYPALAPLDRQAPLLPGSPPVRLLRNEGPAESFPLESLLLLADGLPRSLPFHTATAMFRHEQFGNLGALGGPFGRPPGVIAADRWWVNGRVRSLAGLYVVEGETDAKTLPPAPTPVASILSAFGKVKKTSQYVVPNAGGDAGTAPQPAVAGVQAASDRTIKAGAIVDRYRAGMQAMVANLALPYDLPPMQEALREAATTAGPLKPALVEAFKPRGYGCRFESGMFTLRRRTPDNHVVELIADVGTWSHMVTARYIVHSPGIRASVPLPLSARVAGQYPIGNAERWRRIVANLAVIVDELDGTFLPELEKAIGRAPEWFETER